MDINRSIYGGAGGLGLSLGRYAKNAQKKTSTPASEETSGIQQASSSDTAALRITREMTRMQSSQPASQVTIVTNQASTITQATPRSAPHVTQPRESSPSSEITSRLAQRRDNQRAIQATIQDYITRRDDTAIAEATAGRTPNEHETVLQNNYFETCCSIGTRTAQHAIDFTEGAIALEKKASFVDVSDRVLILNLAKQYDQLANQADKQINAIKDRLRINQPLTTQDTSRIRTFFNKLVTQGKELDHSKKYADLAVQLNERIETFVDQIDHSSTSTKQESDLIILYDNLSHFCLKMLKNQPPVTPEEASYYQPLLEVAQQALEADQRSDVDMKSLCHQHLIISDQLHALHTNKDKETDSSVIEPLEKAITAYTTANINRSKIITDKKSQLNILKQLNTISDQEADRLLLRSEQDQELKGINPSKLEISAMLYDRLATSYLQQATNHKTLQGLPAGIRESKHQLFGKANGTLKKITSFQEEVSTKLEGSEFSKAEDVFPKLNREFELLKSIIEALTKK